MMARFLERIGLALEVGNTSDDAFTGDEGLPSNEVEMGKNVCSLCRTQDRAVGAQKWWLLPSPGSKKKYTTSTGLKVSIEEVVVRDEERKGGQYCNN